MALKKPVELESSALPINQKPFPPSTDRLIEGIMNGREARRLTAETAAANRKAKI
jgi:hypothetical protein